MNKRWIHGICATVVAATLVGCHEHRSHRMSTTHATYIAPDRDYREVSNMSPAYEVTPAYNAPRSFRTASFNRGPEITLDEFGRHLQNNTAVIVDARKPADFAQGHVRGAVNIPSGQEDLYMTRFNRELPNDQLIIVYCGGPDCPASDNVHDYFVGQGFKNVRVFHPGWQKLNSMKDFQ